MAYACTWHYWSRRASALPDGAPFAPGREPFYVPPHDHAYPATPPAPVPGRYE
jgi:hypothetical protein